jgi:hypothetical protein
MAMNRSNFRRERSVGAFGPTKRRAPGWRLRVSLAVAVLAATATLPGAAAAQSYKVCPGGILIPGGGVCPPVDPPGDPGLPPSAVPEPSVWAMLIMGFFSVGGALRQRRRREAAS